MKNQYMNLIEIINLSKTYYSSTNETKALDNININVEEGTNIVYIMYSDSSTIQIVFRILNIEDENSKLNCLYEAISK